MVDDATYTVANAFTCSQFQQKILILWEPASFATLSNCEYLKFYKCQVPSIFVYNNLYDVYLHAKAQKVFWSSKKNLTTFQVIPNYGSQNRVWDMSNFYYIFSY